MRKTKHFIWSILVAAICFQMACSADIPEYTNHTNKTTEQDDVKPVKDANEPPVAPVVVEQPTEVAVPVVDPLLPLPVPMIPIYGGGGGGGGHPRRLCGDGRLGNNEECDDGNRTDGDGCSSRCLFESRTRVTLLKNVINQFGGQAVPADFDLILTGADGTHDNGVTYHSGAVITLTPAVSYTVTELEPPLENYFQASIVCMAGLEDVGNPFEAVADQAVVCTVTNRDQIARPTIILSKVVINDNGGTAVPSDFTLTISNTPQPQNTVIQLNQSISYTIGELPMAGYTNTGIVCTGDGLPVGTTFIAQGGVDYSCQVTNNDNPATPTLTVTKTVTGAVPGLDLSIFSATLTPSVGSPISQAFSALGTTVFPLTVGTSYTISEPSLPLGYALGSITCTINGIPASTSFTPSSGDAVACTINNTISLSAPTLTVTKEAGLGVTLPALTNFGISLNGNTPLPFDLAGIVTTPLTAGVSIELTESTLLGYSAAITCSSDVRGPLGNPFVPQNGEAISCTVVNSIALGTPLLTLNKVVLPSIPPSPLLPGQFNLTLTINGTDLFFPAFTTVPVSAGIPISVSELGAPLGFAIPTVACTRIVLGAPVPVILPYTPVTGDEITCLVTNLYAPNGLGEAESN